MGNPKLWRTPAVLLFLMTMIFPFFGITFLEHVSETNEEGDKEDRKNEVLVRDSSLSKNRDIPPSTNKFASNVCLTPDCISKDASSLARTYPDKTNQSAWVIHSKSGYNSANFSCAGIIYVKNFKAASSTAAGIALRLAYQHGHNGEHAWVKFSHVRGFKYAQRDPQHSLLITSLRDPAARAVSRIFYTAITQKGEQPTDENLLQKLQWNHPQYGAVSHQGGGYQVRYCSMHKELQPSWSPEHPHLVMDPDQVQRNVQEIIHAYDFIMIAERMDESVVVLAMILGIPLGDVLVMDAKQNIGQEYLYFSVHDRITQRKRETCRLSIQAFRSPAVEAYLESTEWYAKNYGDYLLHSAAQQSLDRTITRLGHERFNSMLREYKNLKSKARLLCVNETFSHCSNDGILQRHLSEENCYSDDSGCGYACIDRMIAGADK